jgi:hypothetical protein
MLWMLSIVKIYARTVSQPGGADILSLFDPPFIATNKR